MSRDFAFHPRAVTEADLAMVRCIHPYRRHLLLAAADRASELTDQPPLFLAAGAGLALALWRGDTRLARRIGHVLAAVTVATVAKDLVKRSVARSRPHLLFRDGEHRLSVPGRRNKSWHSMPSGHAAGAAAVARACVRCWPEARLPAYVAATALSLARIPPGHHYPSDVAVGIGIGLAAEALVNRFLPPP